MSHDRLPLAADPRTAPASEDLAALSALGTARHVVPVSMVRILENLMDWEHFPWIHPDAFVGTELLEAGQGWYRVRLGLAGPAEASAEILVVMHAVSAAHARWSIITVDGPSGGYHVYTTANATGPSEISTEVVFLAPTAPRNEVVRKAMLAMFQRQYERFYQQDIAMMRERQEALDRLSARATDVEWGEPLGEEREVRGRAPFTVDLEGHRYWIYVDGDTLASASAVCPHRLGPLGCPDPSGGARICPWHGYRFDEAGRSADGRGLRLRAAPRLEVVDGQVVLRAP